MEQQARANTSTLGDPSRPVLTYIPSANVSSATSADTTTSPVSAADLVCVEELLANGTQAAESATRTMDVPTLAQEDEVVRADMRVLEGKILGLGNEVVYDKIVYNYAKESIKVEPVLEEISNTEIPDEDTASDMDLDKLGYMMDQVTPRYLVWKESVSSQVESKCVHSIIEPSVFLPVL